MMIQRGEQQVHYGQQVRKAAILTLLLLVAAPWSWAAGVRAVRDVEVQGIEGGDSGQARLEQQRLTAALADAAPEEALREIYRTYEDVVARSGSDLTLRLLDVHLIGAADFGAHRWIDTMSPATGRRLIQERTYYDAPWLSGSQVHYRLSWQAKNLEQEKNTLRIFREMRRWTIRQAVDHLLETGHLSREPFGLTTYRVRARLDGHQREYRAMALWFPGEEGGDAFDLEVQDHVIPDVTSAMLEEAEVVVESELGMPRRTAGVERQVAASATESCIAATLPRTNTVLYLTSSQGHSTGRHESEFGLKADCVADASCYNQCRPKIYQKTCIDTGGVSGSCEHEMKYDERISGDSAQGAEVKCGGAFGCAAVKCCSATCSGVSFSFSGSGGGLSVSLGSSGGHTVYDLSIDDRVTCPAPREEQPCGSSLSMENGLMTSEIIIPCDGDHDDPEPDEPAGGGTKTPILLDLGAGGLRLTDLAGGVAFDLDADGLAESLAWTEADAGDAFLVLDRDGDGVIGDGTELFGDVTPQPAPVTGERNGFLALAVFDSPEVGGDGDGVISASDAVFSDLALWRDANHDGVSQSEELSGLDEEGVRVLELGYVENRSRDRHGNLLRYRGRFRQAVGNHALRAQPMVDVILLHEAP